MTRPTRARTKVTMNKPPTLALVLGLALASPALAQETRLNLDKIKATGTILVGYRETSIPFSFVDSRAAPAPWRHVTADLQIVEPGLT